MKFTTLCLSILVLACSNDAGTMERIQDEEASPTPSPVVEALPEVDGAGFDMTEEDLPDWELVWEDGFDGNLSDWEAWNSGAFNEELQYYQSDNLHLKDGFLLIEAKREAASGATNPFDSNIKNFDSNIKNFDFTSGRIETKREYGPRQYGDSIRISARIRLPEGEGLWPAFWGYNNPWPAKGEIDYFEYRGSEPHFFESNFHYGAMANHLETDAEAQKFRYQNDIKLSESFHVYEMVWTQGHFKIYFDGNMVHVFRSSEFEHISHFYDKRHRIVLNLAVGGWFFNNLNEGNIPNRSFVFVDWVRIFRPKP